MEHSLTMHHKHHIRLWTLSSLVSCIFILGTVFIWRKAYFDVTIKQDSIIQESSLSKANITAKLADKAHHITFIPTGIYIHQLSLGQNNTVTFAGYVWQKYPRSWSSHHTMGVSFPQANVSHQEQRYIFNDNHHTTIGWEVRGTLQQEFDFREYPFDSQKITLELLPLSSDTNSILVPDFHSYPDDSPACLPGLNGTVYLQDWSIEKSYFNYKQEHAITNFGYSQQSHHTALQPPLELPKLTFNIVVNHALYSSVIITMLPIIMLLILLFVVLIMIRHCDFNTILGSMIFLFFISLIAYIAFKTAFNSEQIVFLDYMYFILQGIILLIATLTIAYYKKTPIAWIHYEHMLITQILFWPVTTAAIFAVSALFFL